MGVKAGILERGTLPRDPARDARAFGGAEGSTTLRMTRGGGVCADELSVAEEQMVIGGLRAMVRALVADFNRAAGDDVLYYAECLGFWMLFQKQEDRCDKRAAEGLVRVEDLAALVDRLQKEDMVV